MLILRSGWTIFDRLYVFNSTLYIVTNTPDQVPDLKLMISTGRLIHNGKEEVLSRLPTDKEMQVLSQRQALHLFGSDAEIIDGASVRSASIT
jgi:hypothetical protein